jgi:dipeptidyl aminopeptidase/acylaminoacyl peptidase
MVKLGSLFLLVTSMAFGQAARAEAGPSAADYAAATKLLYPNLQHTVLNESVTPHWIGDQGRFWYQRDGSDGREFVVVDSAGVKAPAFDHQAVARALNRAIGEPDATTGFPGALSDVALSADLTTLSGRIGSKRVECDLKANACQVVTALASTPELLISPDGSQALLTRGNDLYVRNLATGQERALTNDGVDQWSWARAPYFSSFLTIRMLKAGVTAPPYQTYWSPDGRYVIAPRVDERGIDLWPYVEWVPPEGSKRPAVHNVRVPLPGDRATVRIEYFLFDLQSGRRTAIQLPEGYPELSWPSGWAPVLGWSQRHQQAFILSRTPGWKQAAVFRVDLASAAVTKVIEESAPTRFEFNTFWDPSNVRLTGDGADIVWFSDRTGWSQLYLYDAQTGRLKNSITRGDGAVIDVEAIDEKRREIYFTATGREAGRDPYYRHLYRARLDGHGPISRLTDTDADHPFDVAHDDLSHYRFLPATDSIYLQLNGGLFVDTWSTVDRPPVTELRSLRDGHRIAELERADASRLYAAGWEPPVRERVTSADGSTDVYAVYFKPHGRAVGASYPIVDCAYNGASSAETPRNFPMAYLLGGRCGGTSLTRLGFAMVFVDGRGTAMRSSAFRDAGYPEFTQVGIEDHVAAIRQLATKYPEIDLSRVGVSGQSWGGTFSAQAILSHPEFYKVAISNAGAYDYSALYSGYEPYLGLPVYANGSQFRQSEADVPENWKQVDVTRLASRLQGRLLISYGDSDEESLPSQAQLLIDALVRANKPYDLLYYPNGNHHNVYTSYVMKRSWDYFLQYLRGAEPVRDFNIGLDPWLQPD